MIVTLKIDVKRQPDVKPADLAEIVISDVVNFVRDRHAADVVEVHWTADTSARDIR